MRRAVVGLAVTGAGVGGLRRRRRRDGRRRPASCSASVRCSLIFGVFVLGPGHRPPGDARARRSRRQAVRRHRRLARENAKRNPRRTAATASALMIGVALVGFITILAASTKASIAAAVDRSLRADYVVDSGSWGDGGFGPPIERRPRRPARGRADLADALRTGADRRRVAPRSWPSTPAIIDELFDLDVTAGRARRRAPTAGIAVKADTEAGSHGLAVGDPVPVRFAADRRGAPDGGGGLRRATCPAPTAALRRRPRHLRGQRHRPVRPPGVRDDGRRCRRRDVTGRHRGGAGAVAQRRAAGPGRPSRPTSPGRSTGC